MTGLAHGRNACFKLDDLAGALADLSTYLVSAPSGLPGKTDRQQSETMGQFARRRVTLGLRDGGQISLAGPFQYAAASKVHGKGVRFLLDEYAPFSRFHTGTITRSKDVTESKAFGQTWRQRPVDSFRDGALSLEGEFDTAAGLSQAVLDDLSAQQTPAILTLGVGGLAIGALVDMAQVVLEDNHFSAFDKEGLVNLAAEFKTDDRIDIGVSLHDLTAEVAIGNYTGVDELAATTAGGVGHLHVTAVTGSNILIKIQDSVDNSVWTDLITFATFGAVGVQRIELGAAAAVKRYVRAQIVSGTITSVTFNVSFGRRGVVTGTAGTHRYFGHLINQSTTSTFEVGPEGSTAGFKKYSGESWLTSYAVSFKHDDIPDFSAELTVAGDVAPSVF
jgi:hypothetical protein